MTHCRRCLFWDQSRMAPDSGSCRIRAPVMVSGAEPTGIWPSTRHDDGCGEGATAFDNSIDARLRNLKEAGIAIA